MMTQLLPNVLELNRQASFEVSREDPDVRAIKLAYRSCSWLLVGLGLPHHASSPLQGSRASP